MRFQLKTNRKTIIQVKLKQILIGQKYGNLTNQMNQLVKDEVMSEFKYSMAIEYFYVGTEYFKLIRNIDPFSKIDSYETAEELNKEIDKLKKQAIITLKITTVKLTEYF